MLTSLKLVLDQGYKENQIQCNSFYVFYVLMIPHEKNLLKEVSW